MQDARQLAQRRKNRRAPALPDDFPAAADAKTLDEVLAKISAMALDILPDNHPDIDPASLFLQITALREGDSVAA